MSMLDLTDDQIDEAAWRAAVETVRRECPALRCDYPDNECPTCVWWRGKCAEAGVDPDSLVVEGQAAS